MLTGISAPGNRRDQGNDLTRFEHGVEPIEETNVLIGHEDVHEATQRPLIVEHSPREARVGHVNGNDGLSNGPGLDGYFAHTTDEGAKLTGQSHRDAHEAATNR